MQLSNYKFLLKKKSVITHILTINILVFEIIKKTKVVKKKNTLMHYHFSLNFWFTLSSH